MMFMPTAGYRCIFHNTLLLFRFVDGFKEWYCTLCEDDSVHETHGWWYPPYPTVSFTTA